MPVIGAALHFHAVAHVDRQRFQLPFGRTVAPAQMHNYGDAIEGGFIVHSGLYHQQVTISRVTDRHHYSNIPPLRKHAHLSLPTLQQLLQQRQAMLYF